MGNLLEIGATDPGRLTARLLPCFITRRADGSPQDSYITFGIGAKGMGRKLCVFLSGVLLSGFLDYRPAFAGQEPADCLAPQTVLVGSSHPVMTRRKSGMARRLSPRWRHNVEQNCTVVRDAARHDEDMPGGVEKAPPV